MFYTNVYQHYDKIYVRGYTDSGKRFAEVVEYEPYLFVLDPDGDYKTWDNRPASKKIFTKIKDAREFLKMYDGTNVEIFGLDQFLYAFINDYFPGEIKYNTSLLSLVSIDIEVSSVGGFADPKIADKEITAITLTKGEQIATFGYKAYSGKHNSSYILCNDERDMLWKFLDVWEQWSPDVITGWSIDQYDIPYIINRIMRLLGEKAVLRLSPYRKVTSREITRGKSVVNTSSRQETIYEIAGIASLDYIHLYRKFTSSGKESYALNHIAFIELGERKVDYSEYGNLDNLYNLNFDLFIDYNIKDALLVSRLEEKLNYIKQCVAIAYRAKVNYTDALTTTRPWDMIIHNYLLDRKIVIPQSKENVLTRELPGAYVKDPIPGLHLWIVSLDYTSEYPSTESQLNLSPETFIKKIAVPHITWVLENFSFGEAMEEAKRLNATLAMNGCLYSKDKRGFIPELIDGFMAERKEIKNKSIALQKQEGHDKNQVSHLDNMAQALKILMNGQYGALSNPYFRWFSIDLAESVTTTGQLAIRYMEQCCNKYLNRVLETKEVDYVTYSDTDSVYLNLTELIKRCGLEGKSISETIDFMDKVCSEKLLPYLEKCNTELSRLLNSYRPVLKINREVLADKAIWRGKKMYILNIWDKEGVRYKKPEVKVKGMEIVRSSTPMFVRNKLKEAVKIIMEQDQKALQQFVKETEKEFYELPPVDIAFPRTVSNLDLYYDPIKIYKTGTPVAVRAAICFNEVIRRGGSEVQNLPIIKSGEKIKWVYLKKANPFYSHVIAIEEGMSIREWTDYDTMWEKSFMTPLKSITDLIKWRTQAGGSVFDFMKPKKKEP